MCSLCKKIKSKKPANPGLYDPGPCPEERRQFEDHHLERRVDAYNHSNPERNLIFGRKNGNGWKEF